MALLFLFVGVAVAAVGLQNSSFESGLDNWSAKTVQESDGGPREEVYGPGCDVYRVCHITGPDTFTVRDDVYNPETGEVDHPEKSVTVNPNDGTKMVRLGGPFHDSDETQPEGLRAELSQSFQVEAANPVLQLTYNVFTFDYEGFDSLNFKVRLTDENGDEITEYEQGAFGADGDTSFKTTGWQPSYIDLSGYEGQEVHLRIQAGGSADDAYPFWAYIDAGVVAQRPVGTPAPGQVVTPGPGGDPVDIKTVSNPVTGTSDLVIPRVGGVLEFPGATADGKTFANCMDLPVNVPINPGTNGGTISNATLILDPKTADGTANGPDRFFPMTQGTGNLWGATVHCVENGDMFVRYTLTEPGSPGQEFIVPLGGLVLIDPAGVIYNRAAFDRAKAAGQTDAQARNTAAISGASVRLQRQQGGQFVNVLSGDPGISPNVNPEITGADGRFQWLTSDGTYRVVVTAAGFPTTTSRAVDIPPEVTDLHVAMGPPAGTQSTNPGGGGGPGTGGGGGGGVPSGPKGCAALKGKAKAKCQLDAKVARKCGKKKGKAKKVCGRRIRALAKCSSMKSKTRKQKAKKKSCVRKAKAIGKPKKSKGKGKKK